MRLHGSGWVVRDLKNKAVTHGLPTTPFHIFCCLHFTSSKCIFHLDILPSLWTLVHLDSAKAESLHQSGPVLSGLPVPFPHPAGPGTVRGSSHLLPVLQRADRPLLGRSSVSWRHILRKQSQVVIAFFFCFSFFTHDTFALVSHSQSKL